MLCFRCGGRLEIVSEDEKMNANGKVKETDYYCDVCNVHFHSKKEIGAHICEHITEED
jgi:hypothetical protein